MFSCTGWTDKKLSLLLGGGETWAGANHPITYNNCDTENPRTEKDIRVACPSSYLFP